MIAGTLMAPRAELSFGCDGAHTDVVLVMVLMLMSTDMSAPEE